MKTSKKIFISAVVIAVVIILVINLSSNSKVDDKVVKVGVIAPITNLVVGGNNLGEGFVNGVTLAMEEYTQKNPGSNKIKLVVEDDGYDAKKGVSAFEKLSTINDIDFLINLSSPTIDSIRERVRSQGVPVLQMGAESEPLKDSIFNIYPDQTSISDVAIEANKDGVNKITAVIEQLDVYEKFVSDFEKNFDGEVNIVRLPASSSDYRTQITKLKETGSESLIVLMSSKSGAQLIKQMRDLELKPKNIYFDVSLQLGLSDFEKVLGDLSYLNGAKSLYSVSDVDTSFVERYKARFGVEPGPLSGYGYDSFVAMIDTKEVSSDKWIKNIQTYKAKGVTGEISFNSIGVRPPGFKIAVIEEGKLLVK